MNTEVQIPDEELFNIQNSKPISVDIFTINVLDYAKLTDAERDRMKLQYSSTGGIKTPSELLKRIGQFICITSFDLQSVSLQYINKRFGRPLSAHKVNARDAVDRLIEIGKIVRLDAGGRQALFSKSFWDWHVIQNAEMGQHDMTEIRLRLVNNAL